VTQLTKTCESFPAQWEGMLDDGRYIYARYRSGLLEIGVGQTLNLAVENAIGLRGVALYRRRLGGQHDGQMDYADLRRHNVVDWL
jgi:hypothetical protein